MANTPSIVDRGYCALVVLQHARARQCAACEHWDLPTGQQVVSRNPAFCAAMQQLSPAQMGRRVLEYDVHGKAIRDQPGAPQSARWSEFGACLQHSVCTHANDACPEYRRAPLLGLARRALAGAP